MRNRITACLSRVDHATPSLAALEAVLSPELLAETLGEAGKVAKRVRKLPPPVVAWLVVGMGLFRGLSVENVLRSMVDGLSGVIRWGPAELPCATAITQARDRLGWEVVRALFVRIAAFLCAKHSEVAKWRDLVVNVVDGSTFLVPDSKKNDAEFGRAGTSRGGKSAYPALRAVLVLGAFTHLIQHAVVGAYTTGELTLAAGLVPLLQRGSLLLMDRGFNSYAWLVGLNDRGVHWVVRGKSGAKVTKPTNVRRLPDGSVKALFLVPPNLRRKRPDLPASIEVRIIKYTVKGAKGKHTITLVTSLHSVENYPATEIAKLYHERWEAELGYRELKTYQVEKQVPFRSRTPDRVRQEAWGLFIAYNCVRGLMADAAELKGVQPRQLSFVDCLARIRPALLVSPGDNSSDITDRLLMDLANCVLPSRRACRRCPRAVKIKMSKWPRKRPGSKVVARSGSRR